MKIICLKEHDLSRGQILLGIRNALYGGLKNFSGGQILIGIKIFIERGLKYFIEGANFQYQSKISKLIII